MLLFLSALIYIAYWHRGVREDTGEGVVWYGSLGLARVPAAHLSPGMLILGFEIGKLTSKSESTL